MVQLLISVKNMETKKQIRKAVLQKRDSLPPKIRDDENAHIRALIQSSSFYRDAQCMLLFASYGSEADTFRIASDAVRDGKSIYFPLVEGDTMDFYRIDAFDELTAGYHGIMEPKAEETRRFHLQR